MIVYCYGVASLLPWSLPPLPLSPPFLSPLLQLSALRLLGPQPEPLWSPWEPLWPQARGQLQRTSSPCNQSPPPPIHPGLPREAGGGGRQAQRQSPRSLKLPYLGASCPFSWREKGGCITQTAGHPGARGRHSLF